MSIRKRADVRADLVTACAEEKPSPGRPHLTGFTASGELFACMPSRSRQTFAQDNVPLAGSLTFGEAMHRKESKSESTRSSTLPRCQCKPAPFAGTWDCV